MQTTWLDNHCLNLPRTIALAWLQHGRDIGINDRWAATLNIYAPGFDLVTGKVIYGVQDDFGNFVEVKNA